MQQIIKEKCLETIEKFSSEIAELESSLVEYRHKTKRNENKLNEEAIEFFKMKELELEELNEELSKREQKISR